MEQFIALMQEWLPTLVSAITVFASAIAVIKKFSNNFSETEQIKQMLKSLLKKLREIAEQNEELSRENKELKRKLKGIPNNEITKD